MEHKDRCFGNGEGKEYYAHYHDHEWGIPSHDDQHLFEMLILEGAQAGLSWDTILKKREGYINLFCNFDPEKVAQLTDTQLDEILKDARIIRNRLKVYSARKNAIAFLQIAKENGSFAQYLWSYVDHKPIINTWKDFKEVPTSTPLSDKISKDLKKKGMSFVGTTIIYSYLQAVGVVNDHLASCWIRQGKNQS